MGKRTKKNPFGGNPFDAPSLPFDLKMPDPFRGASDFDEALGLKKSNSGFDTVSGDFEDFTQSPRGRTNQKRKKRFSVERQERIQSGQAPLSPEEEFNLQGDRDVFGRPITE
jgi:hypothetical protein